MLRQMERSAIQLLAKRGKSIREIADEVGRSPTTIARILKEPVERSGRPRHRRSQMDPYRAQIVEWLNARLPVVRMLELARRDETQPYTGSRSQFGETVRQMRLVRDHDAAVNAVPIRFEGLPGEYLQVDGGAVRAFPFTGQPAATRYFLACRLKYSRWSWLRFTTDMRQETLLRGLVDCVVALGWVPWVLVFDNMKTVTSGRDSAHQPIWTPALLQLAGECGFHPQACDPQAGNQKGAVEALVKWVKGNFLPGRIFADDADLATQAQEWVEQANRRPSSATGGPPFELLPDETATGSPLPPTAADYGLLVPGQVSPEALVMVHSSWYSVPVSHVGAPVVIRLHRQRVRIWRDGVCLADHLRAPDGTHQRIIDPTHFAVLFARKARAHAMLTRDVLLRLGGAAPAFLSALSYRQRAHLAEELRAIAILYERHGGPDLLAAMSLAVEASTYSADALAFLLAPARPSFMEPSLSVPGVPIQTEIDRLLSSYEVWVQVDEALSEAVQR